MEPKEKKTILRFYWKAPLALRSWLPGQAFSVGSFFLALLTLGASSFWTRTRFQRDLWQRVRVGGDAFEFLGEGGSRFQSAVKRIRLFLILALFLELAKRGSMDLSPLLNMGLFSVLILAWGTYWYEDWCYQWAHTRWKGVPFEVNRNDLEFVKVYFHWTLLSLLSLGFLEGLRQFKIHRLKMEAVTYEATPFVFRGEAKTYGILYLRGYGLTILTLGFYYPWHRTQCLNYFWNHLTLGDRSFRSILKGGDYFWFQVEKWVLLCLTLGMAWPWVRENRLQLILKHLAVIEPTQSPVRSSPHSPSHNLSHSPSHNLAQAAAPQAPPLPGGYKAKDQAPHSYLEGPFE